MRQDVPQSFDIRQQFILRFLTDNRYRPKVSHGHSLSDQVTFDLDSAAFCLKSPPYLIRRRCQKVIKFDRVSNLGRYSINGNLAFCLFLKQMSKFCSYPQRQLR